MAHCGDSGIVQYTNQNKRSDTSDAGNTAIEMTLQSAYLNGRSLPEDGQAILGQEKTWRVLRIYVLPRGNWDFDVTWRTESDNEKPAVSKNQNIYKVHTLTEEFTLGANPQGILRSREELGYVEVQLDIKGKNMNFTLTQNEVGQDLVIQGFEVEFSFAGYEVGQ